MIMIARDDMMMIICQRQEYDNDLKKSKKRSCSCNGVSAGPETSVQDHVQAQRIKAMRKIILKRAR